MHYVRIVLFGMLLSLVVSSQTIPVMVDRTFGFVKGFTHAVLDEDFTYTS